MLAEYDSTSVNASYSDGDDLISQTRSNHCVLISPLSTYAQGVNSDRNWLKRTPECEGRRTDRSAGLDCDEFPYTATTTGGRPFYNMGRVSLRPMNPFDNQDSGRLWGRAVAQGQSGGRYLIVPYTEFSFYFSNGRFGI